jgi:primosomal protein N' (replication factor Y) (superfamily II helicase)
MLVRVAIAIPSPKTFTYVVPEMFVPAVAVGKRVLVPFGKRRVTGFILEVMTGTVCDQAVKEILDLPDPEPLFDPEDLVFYEWISRYYLHPLGKVLGEILPGGISVQSDRWLCLGDGATNADQRLSAGQKEILERVARFPAGIPLSRLRRTLGKNDVYGDLRFLEATGLIVSEERLNLPPVRPKKEKWVRLTAEIPPGMHLTARQSALIGILRERGETPVGDLRDFSKHTVASLRILEKKGLLHLYEKEVSRGPGPTPTMGRNENGIILNEAQTAVLDEIRECLTSGRFSPCLLHGVTGSGKTEVYLRAIAEVLKGDGGAIYLVPEIALTAQLLSRIGNRFPERDIAVLHSGISQSARYDQWKRIRRGEVRVVVGARSALFAPVQNLRLIVVDEEHDSSYKQDDRLRYSARDLALVRGRFLQATVILGSATPAIQSYFHAAEGRYRYLTLPARIDDRPLPRVEVVDLRTERDERGLTPLLSRTLIEAIRKTLADGRQTLLFLNRRGFHTYLFCPDCGHVFSCQNCDISLTHHAAEGVLKCHHCDFTAKTAVLCPSCKGSRVRSQGAGTERVEEETKKLFPAARIVRMDSDTTTRPGDSERILRGLDRGEIDILIGTQMITKGHDFPAITLVGVVAADASLNIPDFRAAERTFQILTQVSGRGGRGDQPGRVITQTFNPVHYAVRRAQEHDYAGFYADELPLRRQLAYPPFSRLIGLHFSSLKKEEGKRAVAHISLRAREMALTLTGGKTEIIGPAESPLSRIRGRYRWQLLLRGKESGPLHLLAQKLMEGAGRDGLEIQVDVDPVNFM